MAIGFGFKRKKVFLYWRKAFFDFQGLPPFYVILKISLLKLIILLP